MRARTELSSKSEWRPVGLNLVTVSFYNNGGNMVKLPQKPTVYCQIAEKMGFFELFPFSKIIFWKKKTLTSLVNYSSLLSSIGITFQNKEKYSTQYNYSILQLEYLFLTSFTTTRVCTHTSWLPEKHATARSARGRDKVQTCYFH